jgi:probable rRNA maturation factor
MKPESVLSIIDEHQLLPEQGFLQAAFEVFCLEENPGHAVHADLILCLPEQLQEINRRYRGVDQPTDVISFSHQAQPVNVSRDLSCNSVSAASDCCSAIYLGEILIDINYIAQQTDSHDLNAEITAVFIHGLLHLCGYDHLNSNQKRNMQERERHILSRLRQEG